MGLLRSNTRATNAELRADLDALDVRVDNLGASNYQTFVLSPGVVAVGSQIKFRVVDSKDLLEFRAFVAREQDSGTLLTVDVLNGGLSILSTKLTIDNGEKTSQSAFTPCVIDFPSFIDDSELEVYLSSVGDSTAEDIGFSFIWGAFTNNVVQPAGYDTDAQAFFTAAGITDTGQKDAIDELVVGLKVDGLWTKCTAIYPFVGGSGSSHAVNLRAPGTYDLTFYGGITHSSTGALWDGTSGYGDSGLIPSSVLTGNDTHLSYYSRTSNTDNKTDMGCLSGVNNHCMILRCYFSSSGDTGLSYAYDGATGADRAGITSSISTDSAGFFVGSRTSSTSHTMYKNASAGTTATNLTGDFPSIVNTIKVGALSQNSSIIAYSNRECAFASIGAGLTGANITALTSRVQTYQTALGRQV